LSVANSVAFDLPSLDGRAVLAAELAAHLAGWSLLVSIGLFIGALFAASYAKGAWKAARDQARSANAQLQMARTAEQQREAAKVSAWLDGAAGSTFIVHVMNLNDGPVYDVAYRVAAKPSGVSYTEPCVEITSGHFTALSPWEVSHHTQRGSGLHPNGYVYSHTNDKGVDVTANGFANVRLKNLADWKLWDGDPKSAGLAVELIFRDSENLRWRRGWDGKLTLEHPVPSR
jgi:hypothetical protein